MHRGVDASEYDSVISDMPGVEAASFTVRYA